MELGRIHVMPGAQPVLRRIGGGSVGAAVSELLSRHRHGEWGEVSEDERRANAAGLLGVGRIMSVYSEGLDTVYVITEPDGPVTRILTPDQY